MDASAQQRRPSAASSTASSTPRHSVPASGAYQQPQHPPAAAGPPTTNRRQRVRLMSFFRQHAPARVGQVDDMLDRFRGKEDDMMKSLVDQYGPEPPAEAIASAMASRRQSLCVEEAEKATTAGETGQGQLQVYTPAAAAAASAFRRGSAVSSGSSVAMRAVPSPKRSGVGDAGTSVASSGAAREDDDEWSQATLAALLAAFYSHVDPRNAGRAPREAAKFFGRELELFSKLQEEYGMSPITMMHAHAVAHEQTRRTTTSVSSSNDGHRVAVNLGGNKEARKRRDALQARLERFYGEVAPEKMTNARQLAELFGGSDETERDLFARLQAQYGRVPPAEGDDRAICAPSEPTSAGSPPAASSKPVVEELSSSRDPSEAPSSVEQRPLDVARRTGHADPAASLATSDESLKTTATVTSGNVDAVRDETPRAPAAGGSPPQQQQQPTQAPAIATKRAADRDVSMDKAASVPPQPKAGSSSDGVPSPARPRQEQQPRDVLRAPESVEDSGKPVAPSPKAAHATADAPSPSREVAAPLAQGDDAAVASKYDAASSPLIPQAVGEETASSGHPQPPTQAPPPIVDVASPQAATVDSRNGDARAGDDADADVKAQSVARGDEPIVGGSAPDGDAAAATDEHVEGGARPSTDDNAPDKTDINDTRGSESDEVVHDDEGPKHDDSAEGEDRRHSPPPVAPSTLDEDMLAPLADDVAAAAERLFRQRCADIDDLFERFLFQRTIHGADALDDEESAARQEIDVEEYAAFSSIRTQWRRASMSSRIMRSAFESAPVKLTTVEQQVAPENDGGAGATVPTSSVRCFRQLLEEDPDL